MLIKYVNRSGNIEVEYRVFGTKVVGKRCLEILITPEEILEYLQNSWGDDKTISYLTALTKQYKRND